MAKDISVQNGDLQILGGDMAIAENDAQNIDHLLRAYPGDIVEKPLLGVGIESLKNSPTNSQLIAIDIRRQLRADGYKVEEVRVARNGAISIKANQ